MANHLDRLTLKQATASLSFGDWFFVIQVLKNSSVGGSTEFLRALASSSKDQPSDYSGTVGTFVEETNPLQKADSETSSYFVNQDGSSTQHKWEDTSDYV